MKLTEIERVLRAMERAADNIAEGPATNPNFWTPARVLATVLSQGADECVKIGRENDEQRVGLFVRVCRSCGCKHSADIPKEITSEYLNANCLNCGRSTLDPGTCGWFLDDKATLIKGEPR